MKKILLTALLILVYYFVGAQVNYSFVKTDSLTSRNASDDIIIGVGLEVYETIAIGKMFGTSGQIILNSATGNVGDLQITNDDHLVINNFLETEISGKLVVGETIAAAFSETKKKYILMTDGSGSVITMADTSHLFPDALWEQTGNYTYPATLTDSIGIGTNTPAHLFDVDGDFRTVEQTYLDSTVFMKYLPPLDSDTVLVKSNDSIGYIIGTGSGITINNNVNNNLLTASGTANTINGETDLTYTSGVITLDSDNNSNFRMKWYSTITGVPPAILTFRYNGTKASYNAIVSGQGIGKFSMSGSYSNSSTWGGEGARIEATATETWSATQYGTELVFSTTKSGEIVTGERIKINDDGIIEIKDVLMLTPIATSPSSPQAGWIYMDTDTHIYVYNGTAWKQMDN